MTKKVKLLKVGDTCPMCYEKIREVEVTDLRSKEEKKKHPLTKEQRVILGCKCLHPGDYCVGGLF